MVELMVRPGLLGELAVAVASLVIASSWVIAWSSRVHGRHVKVLRLAVMAVAGAMLASGVTSLAGSGTDPLATVRPIAISMSLASILATYIWSATRLWALLKSTRLPRACAAEVVSGGSVSRPLAREGFCGAFLVPAEDDDAAGYLERARLLGTKVVRDKRRRQVGLGVSSRELLLWDGDKRLYLAILVDTRDYERARGLRFEGGSARILGHMFTAYYIVGVEFTIEGPQLIVEQKLVLIPPARTGIALAAQRSLAQLRFNILEEVVRRWRSLSWV